MKEQNLTLKELQKATGTPAYIIKYLKDCNRLPIAKQSKGRGYPTLYKLEAVNIVQEHITKKRIK